AEDFTAQPNSPRTACLEGVRKSDIYLGILGKRYGAPVDSGLSATEEEFQEARERGIPTLWFAKDCERDEAQTAFFERISSYENGYYIKFFNTPDELGDCVAHALRKNFGEPSMYNLDQQKATKLLKQRIPTEKTGKYGGGGQPRLLSAVIPERQGEPYLSLVALSKRHEQDRLLRPAMFGDSALLVLEDGVDTEETTETLLFRQGDARSRPVRQLEFYPDGTVAFSASQPKQDTSPFGQVSMIQGHIVEERWVSDLLGSFFAYCTGFFADLEESELLSAFYFLSGFENIQNKYFGECPQNAPNSIQIGMDSINDPFYVPEFAQRIVQKDIHQPEDTAAQITAQIAREFRVRDRYFER
ncbi:MAG: DUF4062 domain-containing protein, partial [Planctomycetes bacterium]|nr:DUF4062 domain-containing protein [Planctomycetota bacterium]